METHKNLIPRKYAESTVTTQFTASSVTIVDNLVISNTSEKTATVCIYVVQSLETASDSNQITKFAAIPAGESYICEEIVGQVLDIGDSIATMAHDKDILTLGASGREIA